MRVKDIQEFKQDCNNLRCSRRTMTNKKTCLTESKQNKCYEKFITMLEKQMYKRIEVIEKRQKDIDNWLDSNFEFEVDVVWEDVKEKIWNRDCIKLPYDGSYKIPQAYNYCVIWNFILKKDEKLYIIKNNMEELSKDNKLTNIHIESRQRRPDLKYTLNNIILACNFFHERFDNYRCIVTGKDIDNDERNEWIMRFKEYIEEVRTVETESIS